MIRSNRSSFIRTRSPNALARDWGLLYGYGVFETIRVYDGMPFKLRRHVERMMGSARDLEMADDPHIQSIERITTAAARFARKLNNALMRITLTAGNPELGIPTRLLFGARDVTYTRADRRTGIPVTFAQVPRNEHSLVVRHKTRNQLESMLEYQIAVKSGYRETVFLNTTGNVAEGSRSNIFITQGGKLVTPSLACGVLPGVTRQCIIEIALKLGYFVQERPIAIKELLSCDACFLTNTHMEVMPIAAIDQKEMLSAAKITTELVEAYRQAVLAALALFNCNGLRRRSPDRNPAR